MDPEEFFAFSSTTDACWKAAEAFVGAKAKDFTDKLDPDVEWALHGLTGYGKKWRTDKWRPDSSTSMKFYSVYGRTAMIDVEKGRVFLCRWSR